MDGCLAHRTTWRTRILGYTPERWVPILVAFYDMHELQWGNSLHPVTTREIDGTYHTQ